MTREDIQRMIQMAKTTDLMNRFNDVDFSLLDQQTLTNIEAFSKQTYLRARTNKNKSD